jgi:hypothetical protein
MDCDAEITSNMLKMSTDMRMTPENRAKALERAFCIHEWEAVASHQINIDRCKKCGLEISY